MPQPCIVSTTSVNLTANGAPATLQADVRIAASVANSLKVANDGLYVQPSTPFGAGLPSGTIQDGTVFRWKATVAATGALDPVSWEFTYDASDNRWYFTGGAPLYSQVDTSDGVSSATYVSPIPFGGPQLTVPFLGDYIIEHGAAILPTAGQVGYMSYDQVVPSADAWAIVGGTTVGSSHSRASRAFSVAAGTNIVTRYRGSSAAIVGFTNRFLRIIPLSIAAT